MSASGDASRIEERMEDDLIYKATERERKRRGGPEIEIATKGKPEDD